MTLNDALHRWALVPDGAAFSTAAANLQPVQWQGRSAMLKVACVAEEAAGFGLLAWWEGDGAAQVWAHHGNALLMERAAGDRSLAHWSRNGQDGAACQVLCGVVARLHRPRARPPAGLTPLGVWFGALAPAAAVHGGVLQRALEAARPLLAHPQEVVCLHGDIHHQNVLDFGARGWLAIDPKGLWGERGFDYANLFCNPDAVTACDLPRFLRRTARVAELAGLERTRLLQWVLAWAGLSAAWHLEDDTPAATALCVADMAAAALQA